MSFKTAWKVQTAVLGCLVGGKDVPCLRLSTLKSCRHPEVKGMCFDRDCPVKATCLGNRMVLLGGGPAYAVRYVAPHHKNEGRGKGVPLSVILPKGDLADLVVLHIKVGHKVLGMTSEEPLPNLFMTKSACAFTDVTFCQWWRHMVAEVSWVVVVVVVVEWGHESTHISYHKAS